MRNFGEIDGVEVAITDHALTRMVEMEMSPEEFRDVLSNPEYVYGSEKYPDSTYHRRGRFSIAYMKKDDRLVVTTILYATMEDWCEAAREGKLIDRPLKANTGIPRRRRA